jgi:two-component system, OmpR family, response regulator
VGRRHRPRDARSVKALTPSIRQTVTVTPSASSPGASCRALTSRHGESVHVLIVEDEVALAKAIADGLAKEGITAEVRNDGISGLEAAMAGGFDAIALDLLLPGMNGFKVCASLRAAGVKTPILMLTAKNGEWDEAEALDTGADDYLTKPFSFVVLVAHLRALVRRSGAAPVSPLVSGELRLDQGNRVASRDGTDIRLTGRECGLLAALIEANGATCSKEHLLKRVWGQSFTGDVNVVEVYIGYLRRKVDEPFTAPIIETVRGAGYRMRTGS